MKEGVDGRWRLEVGRKRDEGLGAVLWAYVKPSVTWVVYKCLVFLLCV